MIYEQQQPEEIEVPQEVKIENEAPEQEQKAKVAHETKEMKNEVNK